MTKSIHTTLTLAALCLVILLIQGCAETHDHGSAPSKSTPQDAHAALHQMKYNDILVEFPGHRYSMEIIHDADGLVTAFLTDAHFNPIAVDAETVQLNFNVGGEPKSYTLSRSEQESGKPATFTFTDKELAALLDGWQGEATASVEIGGKPNSAKMIKLGGHVHDH